MTSRTSQEYHLSSAVHLGWQHMQSFTRWHLWRQNTIPLMHRDHLVGNRYYFVPFFVFYTESVVLGPRFIHESIFYTQFVMLSPRFLPESVFCFVLYFSHAAASFNLQQRINEHFCCAISWSLKVKNAKYRPKTSNETMLRDMLKDFVSYFAAFKATNFFACTWRYEILKSKIKELPKFLSSSGRRGASFVSVYNFSAQQHASFGNQHILNFRVMAVRDINLWSCLAKIYNYLGIFWPFEK